VLVAEDNVLNRNLLRDQLLALGATVVEAGNGSEAMAALSKHSVDAVLTDLDMPVMSGFELLREMKQAGMQTPVYAVSASARPVDVAQGRARGFTGYLTKPVPLAALVSALAPALALAPAPVLASAFDGVGDAGSAMHEDELPELPELPAVPAEYVEAFLAQTEADLDAYEGIRTSRNVQQLERLLHRISGTLAVVGRSQLAELCEDLHDHTADADGWDDEIELQSGYIAQRLRQMCELLLAKAD
jgi:two-component system capsular synthesis sensor histidine kinase RcsC